MGGKTTKFLDTLKRFPDLKEYLNEKIVAGESAGANVLAKYCYSPNADQSLEGLGILPIRVIPHYKEEYKDKLGDVGNEFELVLLNEYQTRVFIIE